MMYDSKTKRLTLDGGEYGRPPSTDYALTQMLNNIADEIKSLKMRLHDIEYMRRDYRGYDCEDVDYSRCLKPPVSYFDENGEKVL